VTAIGMAIIGTGGIARTHARALRALPEARLVAVCDLLPERAEAFAAEWEIPRVYPSAAALLQDGEVEAVCICTPHPQHAPLVIQAAEQGKHAICEKPIAADLAAADAAIAAAERAGTRFGVIFQRRFWPAARRLRQALDDGRLGRPILGDCLVKWWRPPSYYQSAPWRGTWELEGGGVLLNQAVHAIDMFQWYMGPVETVYGLWGTLAHPGLEVEDTAVAALRFRGGALGVISASVSQNPTLFSRVTIHGDNGATASVTEAPEGALGVNDLWTLPGDEAAKERWPEEDRAARHPHGEHAAQLADFLAALREERDPAVTGREGRKSLAIIQAIYASGRTGQPVVPAK
jgi:UDP-N-acetyl-2-amino-2-deoxyglucuronate dehydrogenase